MAKYDVTYKCNHEGTVELFGKTTDRMKKIEWMETTLCPECYARQQAQKENEGMQIEEVEMLYSEYKNNFSNCQTLPNSYDSKTKTITVLVPVEDVAPEETIETVEVTEVTETTEEIITIEQIAEKARGSVENAKKVVAMPIEKLEAIVQDLENKIKATENPAERLLKNLKESIEMIDLIKRYKAQQ